MKIFNLFLLVLMPLLGFAQVQPNVIVIKADDLAFGDIGYFNPNISTPQIDDLISSDGAVVATRMYGGSSVCTMSRASFQTGKMSQRLGFTMTLKNTSLSMSDDEYTMGDMFRQMGYHTGFYGKHHVSRRSDGSWVYDELGYDEGDATPPGGPGQCPNATWYYDTFVENFIATQSAAESPFFLLFTPFEPHAPVADYTDPAKTDESEFRDIYDGTTFPASFDPRNNGYSRNPAVPTDYPIYGGAISQFDDVVGRIVDQLKALGEFDNTVIIVTSDNGGAQCEFCLPTNYDAASGTQMSGNKKTMYDGGWRVPFIVLYPDGGIQNRVIDSPMVFYDLLPTFAALIGNDDPAARRGDGENILPIWEGTKAKRDKSFAMMLPIANPRLSNSAAALPVDGADWSRGMGDYLGQCNVAAIDPDGRKIVAGMDSYLESNNADVTTYIRRTRIDCRSLQFYKFDDAGDVQTQDEHPNLFTGVESMGEFDGLYFFMQRAMGLAQRDQPYRDWNPYRSDLK